MPVMRAPGKIAALPVTARVQAREKTNHCTVPKCCMNRALGWAGGWWGGGWWARWSQKSHLCAFFPSWGILTFEFQENCLEGAGGSAHLTAHRGYFWRAAALQQSPGLHHCLCCTAVNTGQGNTEIQSSQLFASWTWAGAVYVCVWEKYSKLGEERSYFLREVWVFGIFFCLELKQWVKMLKYLQNSKPDSKGICIMSNALFSF